jgi:hypothetical protein
MLKSVIGRSPWASLLKAMRADIASLRGFALLRNTPGKSLDEGSYS